MKFIYASYRPEYKRADIICCCLFSVFTVIALGLGIPAHLHLAATPMAHDFLVAGAMASLILMAFAMTVDITIIRVDKHERELAEGKLVKEDFKQ